MTITGESASLTAGAVAAAAPAHRGATMADHTLLGFAAASFGPLAFGTALDVVGADRWLGWAVGFAILGAGPRVGPAPVEAKGPIDHAAFRMRKE